jgi:hypothetical protein
MTDEQERRAARLGENLIQSGADVGSELKHLKEMTYKKDFITFLVPIPTQQDALNRAKMNAVFDQIHRCAVVLDVHSAAARDCAIFSAEIHDDINDMTPIFQQIAEAEADCMDVLIRLFISRDRADGNHQALTTLVNRVLGRIATTMSTTDQ